MLVKYAKVGCKACSSKVGSELGSKLGSMDLWNMLPL
jgi:hypothetical protein